MARSSGEIRGSTEASQIHGRGAAPRVQGLQVSRRRNHHGGSDIGTIHKVCANPDCPIHHARKERPATDAAFKAEQEKRRREEGQGSVESNQGTLNQNGVRRCRTPFLLLAPVFPPCDVLPLRDRLVGPPRRALSEDSLSLCDFSEFIFLRGEVPAFLRSQNQDVGHLPFFPPFALQIEMNRLRHGIPQPRPSPFVRRKLLAESTAPESRRAPLLL